MAEHHEIPGTMHVDIYYHHSRHKWCIDWRFNNMGGAFEFYDTKPDAMEALALFYPVENGGDGKDER